MKKVHVLGGGVVDVHDSFDTKSFQGAHDVADPIVEDMGFSDPYIPLDEIATEEVVVDDFKPNESEASKYSD